MVKKLPPVLRVVLAMIFLAGFSVVLTYFVLSRQFYYDENDVWGLISARPRVFWYSSLLVFLLTSALAALIWRPFLASGISFALFAILTFVQMQKFQLRNEPFLPSDLAMAGQAGDLAGLIDAWGIVRLVAGVVLVLIGSIMLEWWMRKIFAVKKTKRRWWEKGAVVPRLSLALMSVTTFVVSTQFLLNHDDDWATEVSWLGTQLYQMNQGQNYTENGFILGFIYNFGEKAAFDTRYSEESIADIYNQYVAKQAEDVGRLPLSSVVDNVVVILDESFYDPELLGKYYAHSGGDVIPNVRKYMQEYPSGYMYSTESGGSTANVEYAVLTGLSNFWARETVYNKYLNTMEYVPGIATLAKSEGLKAIGLHAYTDTFYDRPEAYAAMQFDTYISLSTGGFNHTKVENGKSQFVSDRESFREVLDYLENESEPVLVSMVTMQNHIPYDSAGYSRLDYRLEGEANNKDVLEANFQSLHKADQYLGEFLEEVAALSERTVVLWFGDHPAAILDEYHQSTETVETRLAYLTPYFIYANFPIQSLYTVAETKVKNEEAGFDFEELISYNASGLTVKDLSIDLPVVSPNCLTNMMYNILGVQKPVLSYLLDDVCAETPILSLSYYDKVAPNATAAFQAYKLVSHDMLGGEHYWARLER